MAARTLDDLRRIVARIGTDAAAYRLDAAICATVRRPVMPAAAVFTAPSAGRGIVAHAAGAPTAHVSGGAARMPASPARTVAVGGGWRVPAHGAGSLGACTIHAISTVIAEKGAASPVAAPSVPMVRAAAPEISGRLGTATAGVGALRRMRRTPVDWAQITPVRLRAAWQAILAEHGHPGADLELVGVYGPLPVGAVAAVAVGADRRAVISLADDVRRGTVGDLALARHVPSGRLLHSAGAIGAVAGP